MPTAVPAPRRLDADRCPGALQVHEAADGGLARIRVPGGVVSLTQWAALQEYAPLDLTSRANVQIRGVADPTALAMRLASAGLLPSATHERVRNIVASPLGDVRPVVTGLDRELCASPDLAALPGRFLFAVDSARDVAGLGADVTVLLGSDPVPVLLAGVDCGLRVRVDQAVPALLAAAWGFLAERRAQESRAWRLAEVDDGPARVAARVADALGVPLSRPDVTAPPPPASGPIGVAPGGVGAVAPLGRLTAVQMARIGELARDEIIVTPWRGVVLPGVGASALDALTDVGLVTDPASPWATATACTGLPGCAKSLADVRADASVALGVAQPAPGLSPVHFVGCERRCGHPVGVHVDVLATADGYQVDGFPVDDVDELPAIVAAARRSKQ
ncbi:precorrin-3B synthase [Cryptosporangium minutisporangium]|uniref:Precorrin-3B synthase n=1 Tax=Cryptosporangium minutisporangium TaxID=113569 RepID=A0ABP6T295_9ACTN